MSAYVSVKVDLVFHGPMVCRVSQGSKERFSHSVRVSSTTISLPFAHDGSSPFAGLPVVRVRRLPLV